MIHFLTSTKARKITSWAWVLLQVFALGLCTSPVQAQQPYGGTVVGGSAQFSVNGNTLTIQQGSQRAVINWQGFSVGAGNTVQFNQPNGNSAVLNRVTGANPSAIMGNINANGNVFLVNPNGILIGNGAQINVGGFTASTLDVTTKQFMAGGDLDFQGDSTAGVVNYGNITALTGNVNLIGAHVANHGTINALNGTVGLAAGQHVRLVDQGNPNLVVRASSRGLGGTGVTNTGVINAARAALVANGGNVYALAINNTGKVRATGAVVQNGEVYLTAPGGKINNSGTLIAEGANSRVQIDAGSITNSGQIAANNVAGKAGAVQLKADSVVNNGVIAANGGSGGSVDIQAKGIINENEITANGDTGGSIALQAETIAQFGTIAANGVTGPGGELLIQYDTNYFDTSDGALSATSQEGAGGSITALGGDQSQAFVSGGWAVSSAAGTGGSIELLADAIYLRGSTLAADGGLGGGTINVGGGYQGQTLSRSNADRVDVGLGVTLSANALTDGDGGQIVLWSDDHNQFFGDLQAKAAGAGNGGMLEVSGKETLYFGGTANASAPNGIAGSLLLDPKTIIVDAVSAQPGGSLFEFIDPNPSANNQFSEHLLLLPNGNVVIASRWANIGKTSNGAVYLFDGSDGSFIGSTIGSNAFNEVGSGGLTLLGDNYIVNSPGWEDGVFTSMGAVTLVNGATGKPVTGTSSIVSSANSLVGASEADQVGIGGVTILGDHYIVRSYNWDGDSISNTNFGAVTLVSGTTGLAVVDGSGVVSQANSLVGTHYDDHVGNAGITLLGDDYIVRSPNWNGDRGAVTLMSGTTGLYKTGTGVISSSNSLVGFDAGDMIGGGGVTVLGDDYIVSSPTWKDRRGAVTLISGETGLFKTGAALGPTITNNNSLVGASQFDGVGSGGVTVLGENYIVNSSNWNQTRGAVTVVSGTNGLAKVDGSGFINDDNSLIGENVGDRVGESGITLLGDEFIVRKTNWNGSRGAVTVISGATGLTRWGDLGIITSSNSIVGGTAGDNLGSGGVMTLSNGHFVIISPAWNERRGAVTLIKASSPSGTIVPPNSVTGGNAGDLVGSGGVTDLGGVYIVNSPSWNDERGAVTRVSGTNGRAFGSGGSTVSVNNSLTGQNPGDKVGFDGITVLGGDYIVGSRYWNDDRGAVTLVSGANGKIKFDSSGLITSSNSLVGQNVGDFVGRDGITVLGDDYIVRSLLWNTSRGAVTLVDGSIGLAKADNSGFISSDNSIVGQNAFERVGNAGVTLLGDDYIVRSGDWNNDRGAVTLVSGETGLTMIGSSAHIDATNSLVGANVDDEIGDYDVGVFGDTYVVAGRDDSGIASVSIGTKETPLVGLINAGNSLIAESAWAHATPFHDPVNDTIIGRFESETSAGGDGRVRVASTRPGSAYTGGLMFGDNPADTVTITPERITDITNTGTNITLQANTDVIFNAAVISNNPAGDGGNLTVQAGRSIEVNAEISTDGGLLNFLANANAGDGAILAHRDPGTANITINAPVTAGSLTFTIRDDVNAGSIQINTPLISTTGGQLYQGPVDVLADATFTGANINFNSTLDGNHNVVINDGATTTFNGNVGGATPLASLVVNTTNSFNPNGNINVAGMASFTSSGGSIVLANGAQQLNIGGSSLFHSNSTIDIGTDANRANLAGSVTLVSRGNANLFNSLDIDFGEKGGFTTRIGAGGEGNLLAVSSGSITDSGDIHTEDNAFFFAEGGSIVLADDTDLSSDGGTMMFDADTTVDVGTASNRARFNGKVVVVSEGNANIINRSAITFHIVDGVTTDVGGNLVADATFGFFNANDVNIDGMATFRAPETAFVDAPFSIGQNGDSLTVGGDALFEVTEDGVSSTSSRIGSAAKPVTIGGTVTVVTPAGAHFVSIVADSDLIFGTKNGLTTSIGRDLTVTTTGSISDTHNINVGRMATFNSTGGSITLADGAEQLTIGGASLFNSNSTIDIGTSTNRAHLGGSVALVSRGNANLFNSLDIDFGEKAGFTTDIDGNLVANTTGSITDSNDILIGGSSLFTATGGSITLADGAESLRLVSLGMFDADTSINVGTEDNRANITGSVSLNSGDDATLFNSDKINFRTSNSLTNTIGGNLVANATGVISDSNDIMVTGMASFTSTGGSITLADGGEQLTVGGSSLYNSNGTIDIGTDTNRANLTGSVALVSGTNANPGDATIFNSLDIDFGGASTRIGSGEGNLLAVSSGSITDSGDIHTEDNAFFFAEGGSIVLADDTDLSSDGGTMMFDADTTVDVGTASNRAGFNGRVVVVSEGDANLFNEGALGFHIVDGVTTDVGGNLVADATGGIINQNDANIDGMATFRTRNLFSQHRALEFGARGDSLTVGGDALFHLTDSLDATSNLIGSTVNPANFGGTITVVTPVGTHDVSIVADSDLIFGTKNGLTTSIGRDLTVTTSGSISDTHNINVTGMASFTSTGGSITLADGAEQLTIGGSSLFNSNSTIDIGTSTNRAHLGGSVALVSRGNANLFNSLDIDFGEKAGFTTDIDGNLVANTTGSITDSNDILIGGSSLFTATGGSIVLADGAEQLRLVSLGMFDASTNINVGTAANRANITGSVSLHSGGDATLFNSNKINFRTSNGVTNDIGGNLVANATGVISDSNDINVTGMASFTSTGGSITLADGGEQLTIGGSSLFHSNGTIDIGADTNRASLIGSVTLVSQSDAVLFNSFDINFGKKDGLTTSIDGNLTAQSSLDIFNTGGESLVVGRDAIFIAQGGDIDLRDLRIGGLIRFDANGDANFASDGFDLNFNDSTTTNGRIDITSLNANTNIRGLMQAGGGIKLIGNDVAIDAVPLNQRAALIGNGGDVEIMADNVLINAGGNEALAGSNNGETRIMTTNDIKLVSGTSVARIGGDSVGVNNNGDITVDAGGDVLLGGGGQSVIGHVNTNALADITVLADHNLRLEDMSRIGHDGATAAPNVIVAWDQLDPTTNGGGMAFFGANSQVSTINGGSELGTVNLFGTDRNGFTTIEVGARFNGHAYTGVRTLSPSSPPGAWDQRTEFINWSQEYWAPDAGVANPGPYSGFFLFNFVGNAIDPPVTMPPATMPPVTPGTRGPSGSSSLPGLLFSEEQLAALSALSQENVYDRFGYQSPTAREFIPNSSTIPFSLGEPSQRDEDEITGASSGAIAP